MRTPPRQGAAAALVTLALVLGATACSGGGSDDEGPQTPAGSSATEDPPLKTRTTVDIVRGVLDKERRVPLRQDVNEVVAAWMDAAYVGGDYPRTDFKDAFVGFTAGAARDARGDQDLMSNASIGAKIDSVEATRRRVHLDVLAVKGRPVGVTARFVLGFDTTGALERSERVAGSLFLTLQDGTWQVFGYDVSRGRNTGKNDSKSQDRNKDKSHSTDTGKSTS